MPRLVYEHPEPDRFVAGTVGQPGQRTFFLQARSGSRVTTVALEKGQVAVLAERVDDLLDEILRRSAGEVRVPAVAPAGSADNDPLDAPIDEEFRVGTMSLAWDGDDERVVIECFAVDESDDETDSDLEDDDPRATGAVMRISLAPGQARAFAKRALAVVAAGRPPCPFCGNPLDADGHVCPRANGYRR
jgi:uncharacterized repeat protein (TIGR03847 family)